jgi:acetylornithine deacetylase
MSVDATDPNPALSASVASAVDRMKASSLDLLCQLISTSASGDGIAAIVEGSMRANGCTTDTVSYSPREVPMVDEFAVDAVGSAAEERYSVGRIGGGEGRSLILFAHPDVEEFRRVPAWTSDPHVPDIRDGRLHGWGVADDLAGMAMMLQSMAVLRAAGYEPAGDVIMVSAPSKQHRRGISAALHDGYDADAAVYLHPAESGRGLNEIKAFAPGQLEAVITIAGEAPETSEPAHTAFAHRGVNPLDKAQIVIDALKGLDATRGGQIRHPRLDQAIGRSSNLMVSYCRAGEEEVLSRMPQSCEIGFAMTLIPGEKLETVMSEVEAAIDEACTKDGWLRDHRPAIEWQAGVSGAETKDDSDLLQTVGRILTEAGAKPTVNPLHTSSDIRNPIVQKGIPTVGFGPLCGGLTMSGQSDEWVDIADFHRAVQATAEIIAAWCGVSTFRSATR